jgi:hypothetical protein
LLLRLIAALNDVIANPLISDHFRGACSLLYDSVTNNNYPHAVIEAMITSLETLITARGQPSAPLAAAAPPSVPLPTLVELLESWRQTDVDADIAEFARYCALCGVVDQRVLDIQLHGCSDQIANPIRRIFSHRDDVVTSLLGDATAAAVRSALNGVFTNGMTVRGFYERVVVLRRPDGVDEGVWNDVLVVCPTLVKLRANIKQVQSASELHLSCGIVECFLAPFVLDNNVTMNEMTFTASDQAALATHYGTAETVDLSLFGVANTNALDTSATSATVASFKNLKKPDMLVRDSNGRFVKLIAKVKRHGAGPKGVGTDCNRLVFVCRTMADLRAADAALLRRAAADVRPAAARLRPRRAPASATANDTASSMPQFGAFGLQVVGTKVTLTVLVQVHQAFYVNLLLHETDFAVCGLAAIVNHLALMIAIRSTDHQQLDLAIKSALFPHGEWVQFDGIVTKTVTASVAMPAASPAHPPAPVPPNNDSRVNASDVVLGTTVNYHDGRAVVRGAGGDVVFKVLAVDQSARHAREAAVHEVRVHMMLARVAPAHVVPLLSHFEAPVALPGQVWLRKSIVMLLPLCERVIGDELIDARDAAAAGEGLLSGLAALHRCGVLHGDVKWSNTLWMDGGDARRLVLADFGLAQQLDVEGRATLRHGAGTKGYMAPEVRDGSALSVTAAADVYSAGMALRKLPAHAVCEPLQVLAARMCAGDACARVSAAHALRVWRHGVAPALLSIVAAEATAVPELAVAQVAAALVASPAAPPVQPEVPHPHAPAPVAAVPPRPAEQPAKAQLSLSDAKKQRAFGTNLSNKLLGAGGAEKLEDD